MTSPSDETGADAVFDCSAMDTAYVSPTYLRAHVREYLYSYDKGVYWLRAPSHTGKTLFVRGLTAKRLAKDQKTTEGIDSNIATGMRTIAFHVRKGCGHGPRQLVEGLSAAFVAEFGMSEEERAATAPNIRYADLDEARADFLAWLAQLRDAAVAKGAQRLLVCIDGLDQMGEPGSGAFDETYPIIDLLPSEVPQGITLLLTSRAAAEWPPNLYERAAQKFDGKFGFLPRDITLQDDGYVKMLRLYFWDTVRPMFRSRAKAHLEQLLEGKPKLTKSKDPRLNNDLTFRDGLKDDWKKLTNKFPRYAMDTLPVGELKETFDQIDKLWADAMDRADQRFKFLSYLLARVVEGSLVIEQVAGLPKGDALLGTFDAPRRQPVAGEAV
jgi:hypothetical protein